VVYEFAAVFLIRQGLSPAFPVTGMDNLLDLRLILQVVNTRLLELSLMGLEVLY
jgi:hypothetical protein